MNGVIEHIRFSLSNTLCPLFHFCKQEVDLKKKKNQLNRFHWNVMFKVKGKHKMLMNI